MSAPRSWPPHQLLGAVLAGGESRRYGRPKALALMGGQPMARWALNALGAHFSLRGLIGTRPIVARSFGVPNRRDVLEGLGPLGGVITALEWARETGLRGAFILSCDMPLVDARLIGKILDCRGPRGGALLPASPGPLGYEPLCGAYDISVLDPARELARTGPHSMKSLLDTIDHQLVSMEDLGGEDVVSTAFINVNTIRDGMRAEEILKRKLEVEALSSRESGARE